jgi:hypothetical protein
VLLDYKDAFFSEQDDVLVAKRSQFSITGRPSIGEVLAYVEKRRSRCPAGPGLAGSDLRCDTRRPYPGEEQRPKIPQSKHLNGGASPTARQCPLTCPGVALTRCFVLSGGGGVKDGPANSVERSQRSMSQYVLRQISVN